MVEERTLTEFADLLEATTGLATPETNRSHLKRVIAREARSRSTTPEDLLLHCTGRRHTLQEIIDAVMIGETYFFREVAQFRYLRDVVAPELFQRGTPVTVWSASCSSGEEAVSLAVLLHDAAHGKPGSGKRTVPICVHASDIRSDVPARIRTGTYPVSSLRRDGAEFHELFQSRYVSTVHERTLTVAQEIIDLIEPHMINLYSDPLDRIPDNLDVVFFRNTLIYAPAVNRDVIIRRIAEKIRPGGYLFLANSELPFVAHPELKLVESGGMYCLQKSETVPTARPEPVVRSRSTAPEPTPEPGPAPPAGRYSEPWSIPDVMRVIIDRPEAISTDLAGAVQLVEALFTDLDQERFERVDEYLERLGRTGVADAVVHYCTAWTAYTRGTSDAADAFGDAIAADDSIWPAYFYRARLREEQDPASARTDFAACIRMIDRQSPGDYRFLVGGFDSRQIRALCVRWIERIDAGKVGSSHGS